MNNRKALALAAVLATFAVTESANAQVFFGAGGTSSVGSMMALLSTVEDVQKEIEALDEQKEKLQEIARGSRSGGGRRQRGNRNQSEAERKKAAADRQKAAAAASKKAQKALQEALLPHQYERLHQIALQVMGSGAINVPEVAEKLKITAEQKKKMAAAREAGQKKVQELIAKARETRQFDREAFSKANADAQKASLAVLTKKQTEQFAKMKGKKFDIDLRRAFSRGRGGQRGQRGGTRKRPGREDL